MYPSRRTLLIAALVLLVAAIAGAVYYFFFHMRTETLVSYACEDGSFYLVLEKKEAIEVAGMEYVLVSEGDGMRYEGSGPLAYTVRGTQIEVTNKQTGAPISVCAAGQTEGTPVVDSTGS